MHAVKFNDESADLEQGLYNGADDPLLALLKQLETADWSSSTLERCLAKLLPLTSSLSPVDRCHWVAGLTRSWQQHGKTFSNESRMALLDVAVAWCAWKLVHSIGSSLYTDSLLSGPAALHLMNACRHLQGTDVAIDLAVEMQLAYPLEEVYSDAYRDLIAWQSWRARFPPVDSAVCVDAELRLEPLGHHHISDFSWQYYDPAIAELCCLPHFQDDEQWHAWLDGIHTENNQEIYAIVHQDWGFIGAVSLIHHGSAGYFYYWIGPDFQGHEFGPRAVSLLLNAAQHNYGIDCCYAKVFDYNGPSRRALEKLGFKDIAISCIAPYESQRFYRLGESKPQEMIVEELHWLLECMASDIKAAALYRG